MRKQSSDHPQTSIMIPLLRFVFSAVVLLALQSCSASAAASGGSLRHSNDELCPESFPLAPTNILPHDAADEYEYHLVAIPDDPTRRSYAPLCPDGQRINIRHLQSCGVGMCYLAAYQNCFHLSSYECQGDFSAFTSRPTPEPTPGIVDTDLPVELTFINVPPGYRPSLEVQSSILRFVHEWLREELPEVGLKLADVEYEGSKTSKDLHYMVIKGKNKGNSGGGKQKPEKDKQEAQQEVVAVKGEKKEVKGDDGKLRRHLLPSNLRHRRLDAVSVALRVKISGPSDISEFALSYIMEIVRSKFDDLVGYLKENGGVLCESDVLCGDFGYMNPFENVELKAGSYNFDDIQVVMEYPDGETDASAWAEAFGGLVKDKEKSIRVACYSSTKADDCQAHSVCTWDEETGGCFKEVCHSSVDKEECVASSTECSWNEETGDCSENTVCQSASEEDCEAHSTECTWNEETGDCSDNNVAIVMDDEYIVDAGAWWPWLLFALSVVLLCICCGCVGGLYYRWKKQNKKGQGKSIELWINNNEKRNPLNKSYTSKGFNRSGNGVSRSSSALRRSGFNRSNAFNDSYKSGPNKKKSDRKRRRSNQPHRRSKNIHPVQFDEDSQGEEGEITVIGTIGGNYSAVSSISAEPPEERAMILYSMRNKGVADLSLPTYNGGGSHPSKARHMYGIHEEWASKEPPGSFSSPQRASLSNRQEVPPSPVVSDHHEVLDKKGGDPPEEVREVKKAKKEKRPDGQKKKRKKKKKKKVRQPLSPVAEVDLTSSAPSTSDTSKTGRETPPAGRRETPPARRKMPSKSRDRKRASMNSKDLSPKLPGKKLVEGLQSSLRMSTLPHMKDIIIEDGNEHYVSMLTTSHPAGFADVALEPLKKKKASEGSGNEFALSSKNLWDDDDEQPWEVRKPKLDAVEDEEEDEDSMDPIFVSLTSRDIGL